MKIARRSLVAGLSTAYASAALLRFPAGAAEFTYKLGNPVPLDHPLTVYQLKAAAKIKTESGGRLDIQVFPNSALGSEPAMILQLRSGALEFADVGDNILASSVPVAAVDGVPFAFGSYKEAWDALGGPLGKYVRAAVDKQLGIYTFENVWDAGFRQMINSLHPINSPDDLKGLKMRVPQAPMLVTMFKAFGASSTPVPATEMYTALQTHLVDGMEVPLVSVETFKLFEVQKYVSMTNHTWTGHMLHAAPAALQKLPKDLRDTVERNFNEAAVAERTDVSRGDTGFETQLKGQGMTFNRPSLPAFKAKLAAAGAYGQWRDSFGPEVWGLLEKSVGRLA